MDVATRYALLRDRRVWDGATLVGLEPDADGALSLLRIPGPADGVPIELPPPFDLEPSGVAVGGCQALFIADTEHDRIVFRDGLCGAVAHLPGRAGGGSGLGQFRAPRGLLVTEESLWVADGGNARLQAFAFPGLEMHALLGGGLHEPVGVGRDRAGRLYVLDRALSAIVRVTVAGLVDAGFTTAVAGSLAALGYAPGQFRPAFLGLAADDTLYVSERANDVVLRFDADGQHLPTLPSPATGWQPRALVLRASWLYVFDAATGRILVVDRQTGVALGTVAGYRGPVTALAVDRADGTLYVKPGLDDRCFTFAPTAAYATSGSLLSGPLDAGEETEWFRAAVDVASPTGTAVRFEVFQNDVDTTAPLETDWQDASALDTVLESLVAPTLTPYLRRYLWLRVTLTSATGTASPVLTQARAETAGESYLDYLPATYGKHDAPTGFLARLLDLVRTEMGSAEEKITDVARIFSADFSAVDALPWLADWVAYELPEGMAPAAQRALLHRAFQLHDRSGTPVSLRELVWIGTGMRPAVAEAFRERAIWQLAVGEDDPTPSRLGFDTVLPAIDPDGIVVADPPAPPESEAPHCEPEIGSSIVGESAPLPVPRLGESLFADTAHRFVAVVPAYQVREPGVRSAVQRILDGEKPAHTEYHLCLVEARMRVGFQARVGVDSIVAGECAPGRLAEAELDWSFVVGGAMTGPGRVGARTHLGRTSMLG